jgi:eukaryotic-like serine/threonine-protein kinase
MQASGSALAGRAGIFGRHWSAVRSFGTAIILSGLGWPTYEGFMLLGMGSPYFPGVSEELRAEDPRQVGEYQLIGRLGAGGMGTVFLGRSPGGRLVAVKVVHEVLARDPEFRARFSREVQAARMVSGAFTAPVIDADADAACPWLASSYIAGPSLHQAVTGHGPLPAATVTALAAGLAEALAAIHQAGLVHRDLKPSNVLLAADGPRVIDFGIARAADDATITRAGFVVGSPGFMSPEQVTAGDVGPPGDVFALGAVLAYAATGQGPFGQGPSHTLLYRVVHQPPELDGIADRELRALISACLSKDPARRPAPRQVLARSAGRGDAAAHFGDGWLPAFLAGTDAPADVDESSTHEPTATAGAPEAPANTPTDSWPRAAPAQAAQREDPPSSKRGIRHRTYRRTAILATAVIAVAAGLTILSTVLPGNHPAAGGQHPPAGSHAVGLLAATLTGASASSVYSVAFAPDGATLATGGDFDTWLWSTKTKKILSTVSPGDTSTGGLAFAPGGDTLAMGDDNGSTFLLNGPTMRTAAVLAFPGETTTGNTTTANSIAYAPGGTMLATGDKNGNTYLWDITTKKIVAILHDPDSQGVNSVAFGPGGTTLAIGDNNGSTYLWSIAAKKITAVLTGPGPVAYAPGGATLAVGGAHDNVDLWNVASKKVTAVLTSPGANGGVNNINALAYTPDGGMLATGDSNGSTYLWSIAAKKIIGTVTDPGQDSSVNSVAFAPDGAALATGDTNGSTYLWDIKIHRT